jgi:pimeloyl-ACP methyl ester carboxylesterase
VVRILDALKIQRAHIIGFSLGSSTVAQLLTLHPERFLTGVQVGGAGRTPEEANDPRIEIEAAEIARDCVSRSRLMRQAPAGMKPTEEEIRFRLEQRVEQEKQVFIGKMDRMSRDERKVENVLKGLGMGDWAAGGSKAIRQYDEDRYEVERAERAAAGITDYDQGQGVQATPVDMFGMDFGADYDAGGGYDHDQIAEDDY